MGKYFLGMFGGHGPNPAACITENGQILAFVEEERLCRVKGAPGRLPISAIDECLKIVGIDLGQVSALGLAWNCPRYYSEMPKFFEAMRDRYLDEERYINELYEKNVHTSFDPVRIERELAIGLAKCGYLTELHRLEYFDHHLCHAASAVFCSGFKESLVMTLDGSGEEFSTVIWNWEENSGFEQLFTAKLPDSLGGYFATFTEFLGFKPDEEEGKLMGLAPYGQYSQSLQDLLDNVIRFDDGGYSLDPKFRFFSKRSKARRYTDELEVLLGSARIPNEPITKQHMDLAFNVQWRLEQIVLSLLKPFLAAKRNVCLAGGVAMNCKMNGVISRHPKIDGFFVQPAAADNGAAVGASLLLGSREPCFSPSKLEHMYLGRNFSSVEIEGALIESKIKYRRSQNSTLELAKFLHQGKICARFNGASEMGARSLGNRSILANPIFPEMKQILNAEVKHRESWRPFCPSVTQESFARYFCDDKSAEFMIVASEVTDFAKEAIPGAVHVDSSARPQKVVKDVNPSFHELLVEFGKLSGHEILINTSFNIQGEPIVYSPRDALRCFGGTGIDVLVMGDFICEK